MMRIFYFISNASDESKYAMQKVDMGKYRVTSRRGLEFLSPLN
jgi:hypothetical protein